MPDVYSLIHYSYFVLFLVILAGVIGLPVPLEGVLLFAGVQVEKGLMGFYPTISIAIIAVFTGSLINYRIASWLGLWKLAHLGKKVHLPVRIWKKSVRFISRYGMWAVPLSYFIPARLSAVFDKNLSKTAFSHSKTLIYQHSTFENENVVT